MPKYSFNCVIMFLKSSSTLFCVILLSLLVYGNGAPTKITLQEKSVSDLLFLQNFRIIYEHETTMEKIEESTILNADVNFDEDTVIFDTDNNLESENQLLSRDLDDAEEKPSKKNMCKEKLSAKDKNRRRADKSHENEDGNLFFDPHKIMWTNTNGKSPAHLKRIDDHYHDEEFLFK